MRQAVVVAPSSGTSQGDEQTRRPLWHRLTVDFAGAYLAIVWLVLAAWVLRLGESFSPLWVLSSGLDLVLLPAWGVLVIAVVVRRRLLALGAVATVVIQMVICWPMLPRSISHNQRSDLEVAALNLYTSNPHLNSAMREIASHPPPVLAFEEFTPAAQQALALSTLARHYRYSIERAEPGTTGMAVLSASTPLRLVAPLRGATDEMVVTLMTSPAPVHIVVVHTFGPQPGDPHYWERSIHGLDQALDRLSGRWLAIGDYNGTNDDRVLRDLLHSGRHDAHLQTGRGYARSWPANLPIPPLVLIDHCLMSPGLTAVSTSERTIAGSDHRMIDVHISFG